MVTLIYRTNSPRQTLISMPEFLDQRSRMDVVTGKGDTYERPSQVRPQTGPLLVFHCWLQMCMWGVMLLGCSHNPSHDSRTHTALSNLKPVTKPIPVPFVRQMVYVPVYSAIDLGTDIKMNMLELAATLSVRNVSVRYPLVLESVRYYDSSGKQVREYVSTPSELKPLATAEFVIARNDTSGGPGAKFLVRSAGPPEMNEPLIEAIMVGRSANAMVSFTSSGRTLKDEAQR